MTGLPDLNFPAFNAAAQALRQAGFTVINPVEIDPEAGKPWATYLRADIRALCDCQGVATLPGWRKSKGARLEVHVARQLEMQVASHATWLTWARLACKA